ncbi:DUF2624 family protein [Halalkalibacter nanhaiisediminis]|uniref:Uncharacterized protein DUF2624 n=1 Tax=Halalkalibacter nanhaiisediminis TaxID=688079 RepID=A0A562QLZ5_9BACI|nr:DUF2624 family protein [Halalkalibacter nanhaiisediminis]TWI57771.1 uncharacterized protein DUF2624 [Halalkalibacter nanhaiisediminis]
MNAFMQQLVNHKINSLTKDELLQLARQHQITLNLDQAQKVITILRSEDINIANQEQVNRILHRLQTNIDPYVSSVVNQLLKQFGSYL